MRVSELAEKLDLRPKTLVRLGRSLKVIPDDQPDPVEELSDDQVDAFNIESVSREYLVDALGVDDENFGVLAYLVVRSSADENELPFSDVVRMDESLAMMEELRIASPERLGRALAKVEELGIALPEGLKEEPLRTRLAVELDDWAKTPKRDESPPNVAVFGAGIAGLTAAHELAERGFSVTVFEPEPDGRPHDLRLYRNLNTPHPPVRLGGMAASQYARQGERSHFMYQGRHFSGEESIEAPEPPPPHFPGEHGFRFFPAYYMHLWDMMQRIPVYEAKVVPEGMEDFRRIASVLDGAEVERLIREVPILDELDDLLADYSDPEGRTDLEGLMDEIEEKYFSKDGRVETLRRRVDDRVENEDRRQQLVAKLDGIEKDRIEKAAEEIKDFFAGFAPGDEGFDALRDTLRDYASGFGTREKLFEAVHEQFEGELRWKVLDAIEEAYVTAAATGADVAGARADIRWVATDRTVYDNVSRIITQASTTNDGRPTVIFPREAPRTFAEMVGAVGQFRDLGFSAQDLQTFTSRLARYMVTSPLRRSLELEQMSAYDFFTGRDEDTGHLSFQYTAAFDGYLKDLPKVLAAFDAEWGDARTNIDTLLQLQLRIDRRDNKADGVLNGPTTTAWFDHWYQHLCSRMKVRFRRASLETLTLDGDRIVPDINYLEGDPEKSHEFDYIVMATDAFTAERVTEGLRGEDIGGTVMELEGFASTKPPTEPPRKLVGPVVDTPLGRLRKMTIEELRKEAGRRLKKREKEKGKELAKDDPRLEDLDKLTRYELIEMLRPSKYGKRGGGDHKGIREVGRRPWDRFQTLAGIQYYFDTEFQLARGHVYYSGSDWALSSINNAGLWADQPILAEDGYVSILSVDIGDWNTPSMALADDEEHPHGKAAWQCTPDELAFEVWRQIGHALSNDRDRQGVQSFPEPVSYSLDQYLELEEDGQTGEMRVVRNENPYLVPIVGDWPNRPGGYPWDPHGTSVAYVREKDDRELHAGKGVWMADHGGYEVHCDQLVFAGTWTKTFTRMTTMEAACESGRHAVNAILDHWVHKTMEDRGLDDPRRAETVGLDWRWPFGFVDQGGSFPVRQPSPAGDYCFIFDIENREPADFRPTRVIDERFADRGLPHPWEAQGTDSLMAAIGQGTIPIDPTMPLDPFSPGYLRWVVQHIKNWRVLFEALNKITDPEKGEDITYNDPLGAKNIDTAPPGWRAISPVSGRVPTGELDEEEDQEEEGNNE